MSVQVVYGAGTLNVEVQGLSGAEIIKVCKDALNLPTNNLLAFVNGGLVPTDYVLENNDRLELVRQSGSKGLQNIFDRGELQRIWGEEGIARLIEAGHLDHDYGQLTISEFISLNRWLNDPANQPMQFIDLEVFIEEERLRFGDKTWPIEQEAAAILKCLFDAGGQIRSTSDIRSQCRKWIFSERLDDVINRKLKNHPSGIGKLIVPKKGKGFRLLKD